MTAIYFQDLPTVLTLFYSFFPLCCYNYLRLRRSVSTEPARLETDAAAKFEALCLIRFSWYYATTTTYTIQIIQACIFKKADSVSLHHVLGCISMFSLRVIPLSFSFQSLCKKTLFATRQFNFVVLCLNFQVFDKIVAHYSNNISSLSELFSSSLRIWNSHKTTQKF